MASNVNKKPINHKYSDEKQEVNQLYDNYTTENKNKVIDEFNPDSGKLLTPLDIKNVVFNLNFNGDENDDELLELFRAYIINTAVGSIFVPALDKKYAEDIATQINLEKKNKVAIFKYNLFLYNINNFLNKFTEDVDFDGKPIKEKMKIKKLINLILLENQTHK